MVCTSTFKRDGYITVEFKVHKIIGLDGHWDTISVSGTGRYPMGFQSPMGLQMNSGTQVELLP